MIDKQIDIPTPMDNAIDICLLVTIPVVISSTCLFNTCTAGSANTTTNPKINENTTNTILFDDAREWPSLYPIGIKPTFTAVKKITRPKNVYTIPINILNILFFGNFKTIN